MFTFCPVSSKQIIIQVFTASHFGYKVNKSKKHLLSKANVPLEAINAKNSTK